MPKASALALKMPQQTSQKERDNNTPLSPQKPYSPPSSGGSTDNGSSFYTEPTPIAELQNNLPCSPASPKHKKDSSRSIFSNTKASKSSSRINPSEPSIRQVSDSRSDSVSSQVYPYRHNPGSSPELGKSMESASIASANSSARGGSGPRSQTASSVKSNSLPHIDTDLPTSNKRGNAKNRFPNILGRSRSTSKGLEDMKQASKPSTPVNKFPTDGDLHKQLGKHLADNNSAKSAPLDKDRGFRDMMSSVNSSIRNRSADRHVAVESEDEGSIPTRDKKEAFSFSSFKDSGAGSSLLHNIKYQGNKATNGLGKAGKAGKGFFGKLTRSGSSHEKESKAEAEFEPKLINLPLVEQTRRTRISKKLEDSRDKTEFWMPALPWRCIDYLNANGCEEEGLYRIPGSGKDIKLWQKRFDTEGDIDLFNETELYDINIVGSMFKAWLRDLPDEILPKSTQARIAEKCAGAKTTPQLLKDELSSLPPYNYYLLFAITCHISLLHSVSDKNKMDYRNLCICFQPCMKIEAFCFQFLVLDWRNCWQGCWTEDEYRDKELEMDAMKAELASKGRNGDFKLPKQPSSFSLSTGRQTASSSYSNLTSSKHPASHLANEERAASSSGSSRPSVTESTTPERVRPNTAEASQSNDYEDESATPTQAGHLRINSALPTLGPIKPLSPPWHSTTRAP